MIVDFGDGVDAAQSHGRQEFGTDEVDRLGDAGAAISAEPVDIGTADHAGFCAERERAHHVLAGADAAVEHDLDLVADRVGDFRQHLDRGRCAVELPSAMVGDHERLRAGLGGFIGILDIENAFEDQLARPDAADPFDVFPVQRGVELRRDPVAERNDIVGHVKGTEDLTKLSEWTASQFDTSLNWKDIDWIRSIWPGKLILKGILDVEDAELAAKTGAQALVVSNHGGRQLDGAPSSIEVLPEIADAVGEKMEIMFDGGIRSGQDVMRALALGAKSCMIGRAYAYGLGAGGQAGVAKAIDIIQKELLTTMGLCGVNRIDEIDDHIIAEAP